MFGCGVVVRQLRGHRWSFPYCSSQADGPATAVFGFPLPFMRMSPVTSATILFAPLGYLLDVVLVGSALLALGNILRARLPSMKARPFLLGGFGAALLVMQLLWLGVLWAQGIELPVTSVAMPYDGYFEFRPVRLDSWGRLWCTPSRWWFPDGWHPPSTDAKPKPGHDGQCPVRAALDHFRKWRRSAVMSASTGGSDVAGH
jgi:hypothetical protein